MDHDRALEAQFLASIVRFTIIGPIGFIRVNRPRINMTDSFRPPLVLHEQADFLSVLKERDAVNWKPDQILLKLVANNKGVDTPGRFVKVSGYALDEYSPNQLPNGSLGYRKESRFVQVVLKIKVYEASSENPLVFRNDTKSYRYSTFINDEWIVFTGNVEEYRLEAAAILDGQVDPQYLQRTRQVNTSEELGGPLSRAALSTAADSTAADSITMELVPVGSKAQWQRQADLLESERRQVLIMKAFMDIEIARRMEELYKLREGANALVLVLGRQLNRIQRTITTLELYLGVEEEIHQLCDGERAPVDTPVTFRQLPLYMDEEMAVDLGFSIARTFTYENVDRFDEWVIQPKNLNYVLPEPRGMVSFRSRREQVRNWDGSRSGDEKEVNLTYFLIRDGFTVHRIVTEKLSIPGNLFPPVGEMQALFSKYREARTDHQKEVFEQQFYNSRKTVLFMQGLLDRTSVFGRFSRKINLFNLDERTQKLVNFIYDGDTNLLSDGRPDFQTWWRDRNRQIVEGSRVLITGTYEGRRSDYLNRLFYYCREVNAPNYPSRGYILYIPRAGPTDLTKRNFVFVIYLKIPSMGGGVIMIPIPAKKASALPLTDLIRLSFTMIIFPKKI